MREIPVFKEVDLDKLHFDPENPRLRESFRGEDRDAILQFMIDDARLEDLMRSIASQGFFAGEPLLVSPAERQGEWIVVEGNRRLAACRLLNDPELAPVRRRAINAIAAISKPPRLIPTLQFATRSDILAHLGYRHVTGIKEWDPLAKARFLRQRFDLLSGDNKDRARDLARSIGSRSDYVLRLLTAYAIYQVAVSRRFFGIAGLNEENVDFSLIPSVLAYSSIVDFLGIESSQDVNILNLDEERTEEIFRWVFERDSSRKTVIRESRNIGKLAAVVEKPDAVNELRLSGNLEVAVRVAGSGSEAFRAAIAAAEENLNSARRQLRESDLREADLRQVRAVFEIARGLLRSVRGVVEDDEAER